MKQMSLASLFQATRFAFGQITRHLSLPEMRAFVRSVARLTSGGAEHASQVAAATARQCFEDADTDGDGVVSLAEFVRWFGVSGWDDFYAQRSAAVDAAIDEEEGKDGTSTAQAGGESDKSGARPAATSDSADHHEVAAASEESAAAAETGAAEAGAME